MCRSRRARLIRALSALVVSLTCVFCGSIRTALGRGPNLVSFTSTLYPYSMKYPSGWRHTTFPFGKLTVDAFVNSSTTDGFTDNVNVYDATLPTQMTDATLLSASEQYLRQTLRVSPHVVGHARVSGHRIALIGYDLSLGGRKISTTQAMIALGSEGWYFTLSVAPRDTVIMRTVFSSMLGTFKRR